MGIFSIGNAIKGVLSGGSEILKSAGNLKRIGAIDKTQQENNIHNETIEQMKAYAIQMGRENKNLLESIVYSFNALIRPMIASLVLAIIALCIINPAYSLTIGTAFKLLPRDLYAVMLAVIGFYFTGRTFQKNAELKRPVMSTEQHQALLKSVQKTGEKVEDSNKKVIYKIEEQTQLSKELLDSDGDGLDDRGVQFTKDSESFKDKMYDCPAGFKTIGYGINLEAQKIPQQVADLWLAIIIKDSNKRLIAKYPFIEKLDLNRKWIVFDMAYNLGVSNQKTLKKTMKEIKKQLDSNKPKYEKIAKVMKSGGWYKQTGNRSKILVQRMKTGKWIKRA